MKTIILLSCEDVVALLRSCLDGSLTLCVIGETWDEIYAGNVTFRTSVGDTIVVFNDCDALDYIDNVTSHNGSSGTFDTWAKHECFPIDVLTRDEYLHLEALLKATSRCSQDVAD